MHQAEEANAHLEPMMTQCLTPFIKEHRILLRWYVYHLF